MEEKMIRVKFLKSVNLIDPLGGSGSTVRSFSKDEITEVDEETFKILIKEKAAVPHGTFYGKPVSQG
jgi:hypothetical protein